MTKSFADQLIDSIQAKDARQKPDEQLPVDALTKQDADDLTVHVGMAQQMYADRARYHAQRKKDLSKLHGLLKHSWGGVGESVAYTALSLDRMARDSAIDVLGAGASAVPVTHLMEDSRAWRVVGGGCEFQISVSGLETLQNARPDQMKQLIAARIAEARDKAVMHPPVLNADKGAFATILCREAVKMYGPRIKVTHAQTGQHPVDDFHFIVETESDGIESVCVTASELRSTGDWTALARSRLEDAFSGDEQSDDVQWVWFDERYAFTPGPVVAIDCAADDPLTAMVRRAVEDELPGSTVCEWVTLADNPHKTFRVTPSSVRYPTVGVFMVQLRPEWAEQPYEKVRQQVGEQVAIALDLRSTNS